MKTMKKYLWMTGCLLIALFSFTSCDEDEQIGNYVTGHWFGDMDMWVGDERALGSEVEFISTGWGNRQGYGTEVDYYHRGSIMHKFNWRVREGIIYMTFDEPDLDCAIVDYRIDDYYFRGYIANFYTLENQTHFELRNYDRYWNEYGYGGYYSPYYVKGEKVFGADSIANAIASNDQPHCIRGVNRGKKIKN